VRNLRRVGRLERVKPTSPRGKTPKGVLGRTASGSKVSPREDCRKVLRGEGEHPEEDEAQESIAAFTSL
jgi:hypothetical protein